MPNWVIHNKWSDKAGIDRFIATYVDRSIDYGGNWAVVDDNDKDIKIEDRVVTRQLKYFYKKDLEKEYSSERMYVKAFYLHHLLDYFRETRFNIYDMELVFKAFLQEKVKIEITDGKDIIANFSKEVNDLFQLLRDHHQEFYEDLLKGIIE